MTFADLSPEEKTRISRWLPLFLGKLGVVSIHAESLREIAAQYESEIAPVLARLDTGAGMPDITFMLTREQIAAFMENFGSLLRQLDAIPEFATLYKRSSFDAEAL
jgi:hypothetical protein